MLQVLKTKLHTLHNQQKQAVEGFPENLAELARLDGRKFFQRVISARH